MIFNWTLKCVYWRQWRIFLLFCLGRHWFHFEELCC